MIAIALEFPAGRYHATPWRRHVNEGAVEWPPSPWRILRALVAVWKRSAAEISQAEVEAILRTLAEPPEFVLPKASTGHTRHFMPWYKKGPEDRTLVFDAFVTVPKSAHVLVRWPSASLDNDRIQLLGRIARNLNSLGRAESWCTAEIATDSATVSGFTCVPLNGDPPENWETIRVLCADPAYAFSSNGLVGHGRKSRSKTTLGAVPVNDPPWNLCVGTLQLEREGWSDPPGSKWVRYAQPRDCFKVELKQARCASRSAKIQVARFALDSTVLPQVTETLQVAEAARRTLIGIYGRLTEVNGVRGRSRVLSGKDERGKPLEDHTHAYYLPSDEDGDGRLDHLTVFACAGFTVEDRRALDHLRELRTGRDCEERHPLRLLLMGVGTTSEYTPGPLQSSRYWRSTTPYIATHYAKTRGRGRIDLRAPLQCESFLQDNLRGQLASLWPELFEQALPEVQIEPEWDLNHAFRVRGRWRSIEFQRFRSKPSDDGGRRLAGAFRLSFARLVRGPIAVGHSSHFGMGLFMPADK